MAIFTLTNQKVFFDDVELTSQSNAIAITNGAELKDKTVMGDTTRLNIAGLKTAELQVEGFYEVTGDAAIFPEIGSAATPFTVFANGASSGDIAYLLQATSGEFLALGGEVGEMAKYSLGVGAVDDLVRGVVMANEVLLQSTNPTNGVTAARILPGAATGKAVFNFHVTAETGDGTNTIQFKIEQDDNSGFTSPAVVATGTLFTNQTFSETLTVAGPITITDFFRVTYELSGTNGATWDIAIAGGSI